MRRVRAAGWGCLRVLTAPAAPPAAQRGAWGPRGGRGGVGGAGGGRDVEAALTRDVRTALLEQRRVRIDKEEPYFSRLPEERRRHWSAAGGLPLERLGEESPASRRFRKVRGL